MLEFLQVYELRGYRPARVEKEDLHFLLQYTTRKNYIAELFMTPAAIRRIPNACDYVDNTPRVRS